MERTTMARSNRYSAVFLMLLLSSFIGCASTQHHEGTGEYVDDSVITTKVKAAVLHEPSLKSAEINVETFKGVVQLSGFVSSQANIDKAVEVARGVAGVKSVKNDMKLK
jgi:osmotically-inducible protein OsmY